MEKKFRQFKKRVVGGGGIQANFMYHLKVGRGTKVVVREWEMQR